jgi:recombination protein RecA
MPPKAKPKAPEPGSMAATLAKLSKQYEIRAGSLASIADEVTSISSGNLAIDHVLGVGGLPVGRNVELYGPPSCGKTTTAIQAAAELQRKIISEGLDWYIIYLDYEHAMDPKYVRALGLDVDHPSFIFAQPDNFEQGANLAIGLIETGKVRLMIADSVASMTPETMTGQEVGKATVALQARLMSDFLKKLNALIHFLNHINEVLDMGGGGRPGVKRYSTPGGRALKFYASVRVEYKQVENIRAAYRDPLSGVMVERPEASTVKVRVVKNKVAPPFQECVVRVRFGRGFDNGWTALQVLTSYSKIKKSGAYYYFNATPELIHEDMSTSSTGRPYIQGEPKMMAFMDAHPEWRELAISMATQLVRDHGSGALVHEGDPEVDDEQDTEPVSFTGGDTLADVKPD